VELHSDPLIRYQQLRDNPWLFLKFAVWTKDEIDADTPIKQFPAHLLYTKFLVEMWRVHKRIAVPKSRRMTASWTYIALIVWDCIFHKGRSWAICSKKELDALELVERAEFIIKQIPESIIAKDLLPKMKRGEMQSSPPVIEFEDIHSKIQGFPSGSNQLRQRGFSGILNDECGFWENAEEAYASAEPTVKGGGRMVMISSRATEDGGFFKRIVFDQLDASDTRFPEIAPVPSKTPMEGVTVWKNPRNEFLVIDLHYTANPAKRGIEFRESLRKTLPARRYRMEYERSWETFDGKAVYEDFNEQLHTTNSRPSPYVGLPLLLGWDSSGLTPAVVIAQMQEERLVVFREIIGEGMGAVRFIPHVISILRTEFPGFTDLGEKTINFFDPAGFKKNEITEATYVQALNAAGFRQLYPGPMTWNKRVDAVTELLTGLVKGQSKLSIYEAGCPTLIAGFKGGYRYPDSNSSIEPDKPRAVKDIHSHPHDAFQYLAGGLKNYRATNYITKVPTPNYGFQKTGGA
jgi:hypothetical protein